MWWFSPKAQPKENHPDAYESRSREIYGVCEKCASLEKLGADVEVFYEMKKGHKCTFPLGRSGYVPPPVPRVDSRLIGKDQR